MRRVGKFAGIGRICGIKIAYVRWPDGSMSDYRLRECRRRFGVSASALQTGASVSEPPRDARP